MRAPLESFAVARHKDWLRFSIRKNRSRRSADIQALAAFYENHLLNLVTRRKQNSLTIAAFLPLNSEPPILSALKKLSQQGHLIVVPVVEPGRKLSWVYWTPDSQFTTNALGIAEPIGQRWGTEAFLDADIKLVPALAYDVSGRRLGQGGGYYDRFLPADVLAQERSLSPDQASYFGIAFEAEILDALPADPWDAQLGHVITENGVRSFAGANDE